MLQEAGIYYTRGPQAGFKEYCYKRIHIETKHENIMSVWCFNREEFNTLLTHWNRDKRWEYVT